MSTQHGFRHRIIDAAVGSIAAVAVVGLLGWLDDLPRRLFERVVDTEARFETYDWHQRTSSESKSMMRVEDGICYLVYLKGEFAGEGEEIGIYSEGPYWVLRGHPRDRGPTDSISVRARCWRFPWATER